MSFLSKQTNMITLKWFYHFCLWPLRDYSLTLNTIIYICFSILRPSFFLHSLITCIYCVKFESYSFQAIKLWVLFLKLSAIDQTGCSFGMLAFANCLLIALQSALTRSNHTMYAWFASIRFLLQVLITLPLLTDCSNFLFILIWILALISGLICVLIKIGFQTLRVAWGSRQLIIHLFGRIHLFRILFVPSTLAIFSYVFSFIRKTNPPFCSFRVLSSYIIFGLSYHWTVLIIFILIFILDSPFHKFRLVLIFGLVRTFFLRKAHFLLLFAIKLAQVTEKYDFFKLWNLYTTDLTSLNLNVHYSMWNNFHSALAQNFASQCLNSFLIEIGFVCEQFTNNETLLNKPVHTCSLKIFRFVN